MVERTNEIPAVWILTWNKRLAEGVLNPYDVITVTIDARDGSVMLMERNSVTPNETTPLLTEDDALLRAQSIQSQLGDPKVESVELTVFRPNYYWETTDSVYDEAEPVRMAWCVVYEDACSVYVDAITGEILGGSQSLATSTVRGRAVSAVPSGYRVGECVDLAVEGLQRLGYTHHLNSVNYIIQQADIEYVLNGSQLKALFLTCHGNNSTERGVLSDGKKMMDRHWIVSSDDIDSNYKFVFLNACYSSVNDNFPKAFLGKNRSGKCFVGWNVEILQTTAYYFNTKFWPLVGEMTILDAVLSARATSIGAGYSDCNPGFSGDSSYYGWAQ